MTEKMLVNCPHCKRSIKVPDQFRGRTAKCPGCGGAFQIPAASPPAPAHPVPQAARPVLSATQQARVAEDHSATDELFAGDCFMFQQQLFQLSVQKRIRNNRGRELFIVEEPRHWGRRVMARVAWFVAFLAAVLVLYGFALIGPKRGDTISPPVRLVFIIVLFGLISFLIAFPTLIMHLVSPRYDISVYRSDGGQRGPLLLTIRNEYAVKGLKESLVVEDAAGRLIGRFTRNWLLARAFRLHWRCYDDNDRLHFSARQSPISRVFWYNLAWGWAGAIPIKGARTFIMMKLEPDWDVSGPNAEPQLARFRPTTEIDWENDNNRMVNRRLGLCLGLLLDSGRWRLFDLISKSMDYASEAGEIVDKLKG